VRIAAIVIKGTKRTRESTVLGMLELSPGDVYSVQKERESFRALYQCGLFSAVSVGLAPGDGEERDLVIELSEATASDFYVEPGYGSYERLRVGFGWTLRNLFGTGRSLEFDGSLAELAQKGSISLVSPRFWGSDVRSTVSVFSNRRVEPSFTSLEHGAGWLLAKRFTRQVSATLGYQFRDTSTSDVDVLGAPAQSLVDSVEISSITLTPVIDKRDSFLWPTEGTVSRLAFEFADAGIGSQLDFVRLSPSFSYYDPLWQGAVFAASWRAGWIAPINSTSDIPLQERFFNGGENTVRSFREDRLGPTDINNNPVGGESFQLFSVELRQELKGNLEGALFYDLGNVQLDYQDFFSTSDFRSGIGVGLRYRLPIGPIRVDYAVNPDPHDSESRSVLHFTVGMAF
jgi:outer membrane protein assembly complex protein YaeT